MVKLKIYNYFKNTAEENISQKFRYMKKKIKKGETRNKEKKQNKLMSKKHKIVCTTLNYIESLKKKKILYFLKNNIKFFY